MTSTSSGSVCDASVDVAYHECWSVCVVETIQSLNGGAYADFG